MRFKPYINVQSGSVNYNENALPVKISPSATVTDTDVGPSQFNGGSLAVTISVNGTLNDRLSIGETGGITLSGSEVRYSGLRIGTFSGGFGVGDPLVVLFDTINATPTAVEALVENISFANVSELPDTTNRTVQFSLVDIDGLAADLDTRTVTVASLNDDPTNNGSFPLTNLGLNEEATVNIDLSLIDLDDKDHAGNDLVVRLNSGVGSGTFSAPTQGGVTVGGNNTTTLTLTGSLVNLNTYLNNTTLIDYTGALNVAGNSADAIAVDISDQGYTGSGGGGWIPLGSLSVDITNINDAPTLTSFSGAVATSNEDTQVAVSFADLTTAGNEADVDGTVDAFVVKSIGSGSLRIGANAGSATAWAAGTNDTIDASNHAYWTPGCGCQRHPKRLCAGGQGRWRPGVHAQCHGPNRCQRTE